MNKNSRSKEYHSAYWREYRKTHSVQLNDKRRIRKAEKKQILINEMGGACRCGYTGIRALQFHHIDPSTKSFELSRNLDKPIELLREEAKKCIILCANCHFEEHSILEGAYERQNV